MPDFNFPFVTALTTEPTTGDWTRSLGCCIVLVSGLWAGCAAAQDNAAEEAAHRAAVLARLPPAAAQRAFGGKATPAAGPPEAIGAYERGCLEGFAEVGRRPGRADRNRRPSPEAGHPPRAGTWS